MTNLTRVPGRRASGSCFCRTSRSITWRVRQFLSSSTCAFNTAPTNQFPISKAGTLINLRQFAPVAMLIAFSIGLLGAALSPWSLLACALIVCGYATLAAATVLRTKRYGLRFFMLAFLAFVAAHAGYGLGYLRGLFAVALARPWRRARAGPNAQLHRADAIIRRQIRSRIRRGAQGLHT